MEGSDKIAYIILGSIILGVIIGVSVYFGLKDKKKHNRHRLGGCEGTRWGCCPDGITPKYDSRGSNCVGHKHHRRNIGGCAGTRFGCCPNSNVPKKDRRGSNCSIVIGGCSGTRFGCCPDGRRPKRDRRGSNC